MKKLSYISIAFAALTAFASCSKDMDAPEQNIAPAGAPRTFEVSSPETKTTLDGLHVNWAAGDEIRVYGHNTSTDTYTDNAVYELTSGAGSGTGTFTLKAGETGLSGTYDEYYAVYPGSLSATVTASTIALPRLNTSSHHLRGQNPAEGQCDPNLAVMTAKYDGSRLVFRHGVAYIKLTIPDDGVTKVDINFTNNCLADTPTYNSETGALSSVGNSAKNVTSVEGTFTKGATYYFAAIPRAGYAPGDVTITLTGSTNYTTSHFSGKSLVVGEVYNLGTPQKSTAPSISAEPVEMNADATAGTISYTVSNPVVGGVVTAALKESSDWLTVGAVSEGSVALTATANTGSSRSAVVVLTYTYNTSETVTVDVPVTQKAYVAAGSKVYYYYNTGSVTNTENKFSGTSSYITFATGTTNCGVESFTVEGKVCTKGLKLDSSGYLSFTTSANVTASVTFYYACRKSADNADASIKITPTSPAGDAVVYGGFNAFGTINSQTVDLAAETTYQIARNNKELALVYVALTETPIP